MAIQIKQADLDILKQSSQETFLYIEILNQDYKILDEIQGEVISANFSIDANSDIRRTCSFQIYVKDSTFYLNEDSKIWINKYFRVYAGYRHIRSGEILKYNLGIYLPDTYSYSYSYEDHTLSIEGVDLMARFLGDYGGSVPEMSIIIKNKGTNIRSVMIDTITKLGKVSKYRIDDIGAEITPTEEVPDPRLLPYDIELGVNSCIYDILKELRDVWVGWEMFFDADGTFICQLIPDCEEDSVFISADIWRPLVISEDTEVSRKDIKNHIVVYGNTKKDGTQIKGEAKEENPESPFAISKIGDLLSVKSDSDFEKIFSNEYANQRAEYELYLSARINDTISIQSMMIPWIEVNQKISYQSAQSEETLEYIVKSVNFELSNNTMNVSMMRFYPKYPSIVHYHHNQA